MRRFIANIFFAFLVLILISFLSFESRKNSSGLTVNAQKLSNQNNSNAFANDDGTNLDEIKFVCKDVELRPIWVDLLKEKKLSAYFLAVDYRKNTIARRC